MKKGGEAAPTRVTYLVIREAEKSGNSNRRRRKFCLTLNKERITIFAYLLWGAMLAVKLLRAQESARSREKEDGAGGRSGVGAGLAA
jgi:hypothetical protein